MLKNGADTLASSSQGYTPLEIAAFEGNTETVRVLHDNIADVSVIFNEIMRAFRQGVYRGHEGVVRLLLDKGADHSAIIDGWTALHIAGRERYEEVVRVLLESGADYSASAHE